MTAATFDTREQTQSDRRAALLCAEIAECVQSAEDAHCKNMSTRSCHSHVLLPLETTTTSCHSSTS